MDEKKQQRMCVREVLKERELALKCCRFDVQYRTKVDGRAVRSRGLYHIIYA